LAVGRPARTAGTGTAGRTIRADSLARRPGWESGPAWTSAASAPGTDGPQDLRSPCRSAPGLHLRVQSSHCWRRPVDARRFRLPRGRRSVGTVERRPAWLGVTQWRPGRLISSIHQSKVNPAEASTPTSSSGSSRRWVVGLSAHRTGLVAYCLCPIAAGIRQSRLQRISPFA
jgi:hypothetical protein